MSIFDSSNSMIPVSSFPNSNTSTISFYENLAILLIFLPVLFFWAISIFRLVRSDSNKKLIRLSGLGLFLPSYFALIFYIWQGEYASTFSYWFFTSVQFWLHLPSTGGVANQSAGTISGEYAFLTFFLCFVSLILFQSNINPLRAIFRTSSYFMAPVLLAFETYVYFTQPAIWMKARMVNFLAFYMGDYFNNHVMTNINVLYFSLILLSIGIANVSFKIVRHFIHRTKTVELIKKGSGKSRY